VAGVIEGDVDDELFRLVTGRLDDQEQWFDPGYFWLDAEAHPWPRRHHLPVVEAERRHVLRAIH
jgi:hypothetical protein